MSAGADRRRQWPTTPALLERDDELAAAAALLARTRDGGGGLLLVEGAPGVGKTALLDGAARAAAEAGFAVLRARGHELERTLAWGTVRTLLEQSVLDATAAGEGLLDGPATAAAVVFAPPDNGDGATSPDTWFAIAHALYRVVVGLTDRAPLLLVVDDSHWADEPSLRFVLYLASRLSEQSVAMLVAARPGERGDSGPLDVLAADSTTAVRRLAPLGAGAVATLVRERHPRADADFCRRCAELTGGNPFELQELLAAVDDEAVGDAGALDDAVEVAAGSLGRSALRRLAARSAQAQALARAVAVLEPLADPGLALQLAGLGPDAMIAAVDELEAAYVVRSGETLTFAHPLLRAAVYATLRYSERTRLHRAAAELLRDRGAAPDRVGAHLLESLPAGDGAVVEVLRAAARRALEQGAPAAAARYLARALREPPGDALHATVLAELGRAEALGAMPEAPTHLEAAIERTDDRRERAVLLQDLARALPQARRLAESSAASRRAMDELGDDGSDLALDLEADYLTSAIHVPELVGEVRRRVARILATDAALSSRARRGLASKAMIVQLFAGAPYEEILSLAGRIFGDGRLVEEDRFDSQVLTHVISTFGWCDDYRSADGALRLTFARAQRTGSAQAFATASQLRARQRLWTGPATDALADAAAAVDLWRDGAVVYLHASTYCLVCALLEAGAVDEAAATLERTDPGGPDSGRSAWRHAARGALAAQRGEDEAALDAFLACGARLEGLLVANPVVLPWRSQAGMAAARLGRSAQARELVDAELALALGFGAPRALAIARQAAGLLAADRDVGIGLLREAAAGLAQCGARLQQARALVDLGGAIRRAGRPREAREPLRQALQLAEATHGAAIAQQARAELRLAGGRAPAAAGASDPLTPSERRVADLAAGGQTNRQIADALFLTVKSIEWHLSNVYRKLGVGGRRELAGALAVDGEPPRG